MGFIYCSIISLFLVLQLQTLFVSTQNIINGSVPVGKSLTASESQQLSSSWRSPSGDFAFGFRKIPPNDGFTLSIWFDNIADKTIVWHAQVNITGLVPDGSKVTLQADGGLVLTDPKGQQLWNSSLSRRGSSVSRGHMTDTGNFLLLSEDFDEELWSSFANPTDTLLPTQSLALGRNISSRRTETSFTKGKFRLRLDDNEHKGDVQLLVLNSRTPSETDVYFWYYNSITMEPNPGIRLVFNESGYMYVLRRDNSTRAFINSTVSSRDYYHRAVLHFDGVFTQYYHPKGQGNSGAGWSIAGAVPGNICNTPNNYMGTTSCGFNSICSLGENSRPKCQCPGRFSLMDSSDEYGDCTPDFEMLTCGIENNKTAKADITDYGFISEGRTDWLGGDYDRFMEYDLEECKKACLDDCLCVAFVFSSNKVCSKKKFPLSDGIREENSISTTYFKVLDRTRVDPAITIKRGENDDWVIITCSVLLGASAFVIFILVALYSKIKKSMKLLRSQVRDTGAARARATAVELNMRVFTYKELVAATGDFMEELGRGAFGIVYKGVLKVSDDPEVTVAVKKLDRVVQEGEKEFTNEVKAIGQTHHKNLVRLIGFCNEGQSRLIVYEFLPNGTLANFLFRRPRPSWEDRTRIAVGIARGILYLHEECCKQIVHCDIKPQNILLDKDNSPRISDFGLAKLLMMNQTHTLTNIRGTKGYVATEWFRNSPITSKVDVYSYGVMLLEIVCCKKAVDLEDNVILIDWAYDCFRQGNLDDLIVGDLEAIEDMETVERYVKIAIWCIQEEPGLRPNMRCVTQMLEGVIQVHDPPNPSPYSTFACYESVSNVQV